MTPTPSSVKRAREIVNGHWNGEYCPREVAINIIALALDAQREKDAQVADDMLREVAGGENVGRAIRGGKE